MVEQIPAADAGDMVMATVEKGKLELRRKIHAAVVIQQRKSSWRKMFLYFGIMWRS